MRLHASCLPYLRGESFATDLRVRFEPTPGDAEYVGRIQFLTRLCQGRNVIHLGCVDHNADTIQNKLKRGKWLHKELCDVTQRCLGVDLDKPGIEFIRSLGYPDVVAANIITEEIPALAGVNWDYLLVPEVLEHIGNPVQFLTGIREQLAGKFGKLVVTVPNAFCAGVRKFTRNGIEVINSDHRHWFSPYTLHKILYDAGFAVEELVACKQGRVKPQSFIKNFYYRRHPLFRDDLVAIATVIKS